MITFIEAFAKYGRDSMAIAKACDIREAVAYNLIAARVGSAENALSIEKANQRREYRRGWYAKNKQRLADIRKEAGRAS
jgi:hypothetical protein